MTFNKSSKLFPIKNRYKYFSHCAVAPLYGPAWEKEQKISEKHMKAGEMVFKEHYVETLDALRTAAADLLKTKAENLAFVKNTSEAMSMIANGYPFREGDEIISYTYEYPANYYPWRLQERRGARLKLLPDRDMTPEKPVNQKIREKWPGEILPCGWSMNDLETLVTGRTKIVAVSHTQFPCGYTADLKRLGEFCTSRGIDLVLDVAQSLGAVPVYPEEYHISAVVSSGWKWMLGPVGTGLMYTSESFRAKLNDVSVGAEVMLQGTDYLNHSWHPHDTAKRFEYSTSPLSLAAALEVSIRELAGTYKPEMIRTELLRLQDLFIGLLDPSRYRPVIFDPPSRSAILGVICLKTHPETIVDTLEKKKIVFTARGGYLRFAPHFYNTEEEIEETVSILNTL
jgi:selenocysteine lyase/cysteine desulfurase